MVRQSVARSAVLERLRTKTAAKPLRPRVETYAFTEEGKILAGKYPDGSVGVFGGGVDGDSLEAAAKKEYREEGGRTLTNVEKLPVKPLTKKWSDDPTVGASPKHKKRMEQFSGSKTIFMTGEVGKKAKVVDGHKLKGVRAYTIEELIKAQKKSLKSGDKEMADIKRARLAVLERLRDKTASSLDELKAPNKNPTYFPEVYGHEAGHAAYDKRMGRLGKAIDVGSQVGGMAGFGTSLAGLVTRRPELMGAGAMISAASDVPAIAEEAYASRYAVKNLQDTLTPEEMAHAKKRLAAAGASYVIPTAIQGASGAASVAGTALDNAPLKWAGGIGSFLGKPLSMIGDLVTSRMVMSPEGKKVSAGEIKKLHKKLAPDVGLKLSDRPTTKGPLYLPKLPEGKIGDWLGSKVLEDPSLGLSDKEKQTFRAKGGIFVDRMPESFRELAQAEAEARAKR